MRLEKVNTQNYYKAMNLKLAPGQEHFVASNSESLAEAYAVLAEGRFVQPFCLYEGETLVGFAMVGHNSFVGEDMPQALQNSYYLWRFMIDRDHQGKGYGKSAMALIMEYIRSFPDGPEPIVSLSYEPENKVAKHMYESFGFRPNGEMDYDEEIAVLRL